MSTGGVIPELVPREVGWMEDVDGVRITFSLNYDHTVRVQIGSFTHETVTTTSGVADLDKEAREQFMRLWCEAERQAEASDG